MSWFEDQITSRIHSDEESVRKANIGLSSVVMGKKIIKALEIEKREAEKNANDEIQNYYHVDNINQLIRRSVKLSDDWYKNATGAFLGKHSDGQPVALLPIRFGGYSYFDYNLGKRVKVNKKTDLSIDAECFYRQLPRRPITLKDVINFVLKDISMSDLAFYLLCSFFAVLLGLFLPYIYDKVFSSVIALKSYTMLWGISTLFITVILSQSLIEICKSMVLSKIHIKMDISLVPAVYYRMLTLPATFFRKYSSGELSEKSMMISQLQEIIFGSVLTAVINFIFSFVYILQMGSIAPDFAMPALYVILALVCVSLINTFVSVGINRKSREASAKLSGLLYTLITGIQKIRLTGSERRAYIQWANTYKEKARYTYNPPLIMKISSAINVGITLLSTIVFFYIGAHSHVPVAQYMAFTAGFSLMSGAIMSLAGVVSSIAQINPILKLVHPILDEQPELYADKQPIMGKLSGNISINNVSFRYSQNSPYIFKNFSLQIKNNEYIGIVGKTGCGKSTLIRLLLGFEKPEKGVIYYGGRNLDSYDIHSLRRNIGAVLQNSQLFVGSLFSNIAICNPKLTEDQAWDIARMVGLDKDIEDMPMGMQTLVSERGKGFSGGQKQRIIIARALASNPSVIIFDEATSALDNLTQQQVSKSLDSIKCTKIVIAHRLSTIKNCDRIIVLKDGLVVEEGNFDQLMKMNGYFTELVKRQI